MLDEREQLPSNTDMRQISVWIKCWCPFDLKRPQCDNGNQLDLLTLWYTCSEKKRSMRNGPCVHYVFRMKITAENACVQPWSGTEPELIRGLYQAFFLPFPLECAASWCVPADLKMLTVHIWVIKESLFTSNNLNPLKHCPESIVLHSPNWHHRRMKGDCNHDYLSVDLCSQMTRMQRLPWLQKKNDLPREINVK